MDSAVGPGIRDLDAAASVADIGGKQVAVVDSRRRGAKLAVADNESEKLAVADKGGK